MRPFVILTFACAFCVVASSAHAASGIAMRWDRCYGAGGENNKNFACNTNSGSDQLVLSFIPTATFEQWSGLEINVEGVAGSALVPSWWMVRGSGQCRNGSLTVNVVPGPSPTTCTDPYAGNGAGGVGAYNVGFGGRSNLVRLILAFAVPTEFSTTLNTGTEYFACNIVINHAKSIGTGACSGCAEPFCLLFKSIRLTRPAGLGDQFMIDPIAPFSATVGWQGASPTLYYDPGFIGPTRTIPPEWGISTCASATPTLAPTWGMIKSLYR